MEHREFTDRTDGALDNVERTTATDHTPIVVPKFLWDTMVFSNGALIKMARATAKMSLRVIKAHEEGGSFAAGDLDRIERMLAETLTNLDQETKELAKLENFFQWVPPDDMLMEH